MAKSKDEKMEQMDNKQIISITSVSIIEIFFKYGSPVVIVWILGHFTYLSIAVLSGKNTYASFITKGLIPRIASHDVITLLGIVFGVSGVGYGKLENKLRKKTLKDYNNHNAELQKRIDPERTSSELTITGDTNPKDKR